MVNLKHFESDSGGASSRRTSGHLRARGPQYHTLRGRRRRHQEPMVDDFRESMVEPIAARELHGQKLVHQPDHTWRMSLPRSPVVISVPGDRHVRDVDLGAPSVSLHRKYA